MKLLLIYAALLLLLCPVLRAQKPLCPPPPSRISIEDGAFSSQPDVTFRLHHFAAVLVPMGKTNPSCYQKMTVVSHAEIFVSNESLSRIFSQKLAGSNSKISDFHVENGLAKTTLTGKITKIIPIQFSIDGPVTTDGTLIKLEAKSIKADGIPVKALLQLVGEHLNAMFQMNGVKGIVVQDNSISFSPEQVAHLKGHITSIETSPQGLTLRYAPQRSGPK